MNTNISITLDTRRKKKDGTFPLIMRLGHNERTTSINLGIDLLEKDWDAKNKLVRKSFDGVTSLTRLNNLIQKKKTDAMDIILKLHEAKQLQLLSVNQLKDKLVQQGNKTSFFTFGNALVADLYKAQRIGTAKSYEGVLKILKNLVGGKELAFTDITYSFLTRFETEHKSKGNGLNGLAVYMRTMRSIYNKAIKEGVVDKEAYPFSDYKIKTEPTEKRALEWNFIQAIINVDLEKTHLCFHARNYFVSSYMMYGMNFTDMAFLLKTDIQNNRIYYRRKKTSKLYDIKINEGLQEILNFYSTAYPDNEYVFPIIKRVSALHQDKDIQGARKRYNKKLKILAKLCGIEKNLTSYVSRHSFATQAMLLEVPVKAISVMLGHSSIKTTETYLASLPSNVLDIYNEKILNPNAKK